jgi:hypothetical protein
MRIERELWLCWRRTLLLSIDDGLSQKRHLQSRRAGQPAKQTMLLLLPNDWIFFATWLLCSLRVELLLQIPEQD